MKTGHSANNHNTGDRGTGDKGTGDFRMKRITEPELMDDPRQAAAYAGSDLDSAYWLFMQLFNRYFSPG